MWEISIQTGDIRDVDCDVVVLKYAQAFYGADAWIASALGVGEGAPHPIDPPPDQHVLIASKGVVRSKDVIFVGVVPLYSFDYSEIRAFTRKSLSIVATVLPTARTVAMTMHGVGYGLDERESFLAQLGGITDATSDGVSGMHIFIVERDERRAERMKSILRGLAPEALSHASSPTGWKPVEDASRSITAGTKSMSKPHVFVAMPFSKELEDVYVFGIQNPINNAGYLCERVDMSTFTGDILDRIKTRIETSALVIADLTGASANVYLEVGYAWGKNRPTLLLAKKSEELKFDVRGQRCIVYENIVDLARRLEQDLAQLVPA